jgi:hypothetical protein
MRTLGAEWQIPGAGKAFYAAPASIWNTAFRRIV